MIVAFLAHTVIANTVTAIRTAALNGHSAGRFQDARRSTTVTEYKWRRKLSGLLSGQPLTAEIQRVYERCLISAAIPVELSLTTGRRGGNDSGSFAGRRSTVPITGASSMPSA